MKKLQLFISYSHKDDTYRLELDKWLVNLKEKNLIESWYDGNLLPGDPLMSKISQKIDGGRHTTLIAITRLPSIKSLQRRDGIRFAIFTE